LKRQRRRSELGKLLNVLKRLPWPTRNGGTTRGPRERRRERGKNKRGNWLKEKKLGNKKRTCESSLVGLKAEVTFEQVFWVKIQQ